MPNDMHAHPEVDRQLEAWAHSKGGLSPETQQKIVGALAPSLHPVNVLPSQTKLVFMFLGVFAICVAAIVPVTGWIGIHLMTGGQIASMTMIFAAGAILFAYSLASRMVPGSATRIPLGMVLAVSGAALTGVMAGLFPWRVTGGFASEGWPCAVLELVVSIPAAALFWLIARRGAPFRGPGLGIAVAGLSVLVALTIDQSQCMFPQAPHLLVWHGGTAILLIALGAFAGFAARRFRAA